MHTNERRKRKRKPTLNGRFLGSSIAYELGLVKMAIEVEKEFKSENARKELEKKLTR
jgi:hypothetical protein